MDDPTQGRGNGAGGDSPPAGRAMDIQWEVRGEVISVQYRPHLSIRWEQVDLPFLIVKMLAVTALSSEVARDGAMPSGDVPIGGFSERRH